RPGGLSQVPGEPPGEETALSADYPARKRLDRRPGSLARRSGRVILAASSRSRGSGSGEGTMTTSNGRGLLLGIGGLVLGLLVGYVVGRENGPRQGPSERNLDASLWLQTAGEYRALCLQTYRTAGEHLLRKRAAQPKGDAPPAVIMDLDETVLDNSPFQTW